jgi:hypothetical protein
MKAKNLLFIIFFTGNTLLAQTTWYVKTVAMGSGNGTSWSNASNNLQNVINTATANDQIWVASGTYIPSIIPDPTNTNPRNATFLLKDGVKLYGGFTGTEALLTDRNWVTNITTLSGSNTYYHVVVSVNDGPNTLIDGFTIKAGHSYEYTAPFPTVYTMSVENILIDIGFGAGLYFSSSSPSLSNCSIIENNSYIGGAGMHIENNAVPSTIINCIFKSNNAVSFTAAISNSGSGSAIYATNSKMNLINCEMSSNTSKIGGTIINNGVTATYTKCKIENNACTRCAGAGMSNTNSTIIMDKSVIRNNTFYLYAGGILNTNSNFTLRNSFVLSHKNVYNGGPISPNYRGLGITNNNTVSNITNSVFFDNGGLTSGGYTAGAIYNENSSNTTFKNCTIVRNRGGTSPGSGIFNEAGTTTIIANSIIWNNTNYAVTANPGSISGFQDNI